MRAAKGVGGVVDGVGHRATFAEFGAAVVDEVLTPRYLEAQLNTALTSLLAAPAWLSGFPAELRSARAAGTRLVADDGRERRFAVTVRAELAAELGPRALAFGIDTDIEADLTARVHAYRPAVIGIEIDPVAADDIRIGTSARSDWLPRVLLDDGGSRLAGAAQRSLPLVVATVNRALVASAPRRRVDVLGRIHRYQRAGVPADPVHTGTLGADERREWPLELAEQEQARVRLWAGRTGDPPGRAGGGPGPAGVGEVRLEVVGAGGTPVGATAIPVRRHAPDLDTAEITVPATDPAGYRVRLSNGTGWPVSYRIAEQRTVVPGERIAFAEFGAVLVERGINRDTVRDAVAHELARHDRSMIAAPALVRGTATPRLAGVAQRPAGPDELCFALTLDIELELFVGPGAKATGLAATLRAEVPLRITTTVGPAALRLEFGQVPATGLRIVEPPRRVAGRYLPIPLRKLTELLPAQVAQELNRRLGQAGRRIVVSEVASSGPPPEFSEPHVSLRTRTQFSGTAAAGEPVWHPVRLTDEQRVLVTARVDAAGSGAVVDPHGAPTVELAVCDDHGGVWAADHAPVPAGGEAAALAVRFTAPETGQWRLRISSDRAADLHYRIRVRPLRAENDPTDPDQTDPDQDPDS